MNNISSNNRKLLRLYPSPFEQASLRGLYLDQKLHRLGTCSQPFVYTNFIASIDGRISQEHSQKKTRVVPKEIANPIDWRLYQELAAQADVLITSGRYIRQLSRNVAQDDLPVSEQPNYADLIQWRKSQGLLSQPAIVIVSASLNFSIPESLLKSKRLIYVATGSKANPMRVQELTAKGVQVIFAGNGQQVGGSELITALGQEGFSTIYMITGPKMLNTLLVDRMLDRLYLTQALRIVGGQSFDTLFEGSRLNPPADFSLHSMYYDAPIQKKIGQIFTVYESDRAR